MLSKAQVKFVKSLQVKKYRKQEQCFLVEGTKSVLELMQSDFEISFVAGTSEFLDANAIPQDVEVFEVSEAELSALGEFKSNNGALAIARMKPNTPISVGPDEFALVLDDIHDPGNLGTIIRTADWFGINKLIVSPETADFYSSKVITSTMGSFTRVKVFYTDLESFFAGQNLPVFGAYLEGESTHTKQFGKGGFVLIGSESHGISPSLKRFVTDPITIPGFGKAESLNAAIATAIICDSIRRG